MQYIVCTLHVRSLAIFWFLKWSFFLALLLRSQITKLWSFYVEIEEIPLFIFNTSRSLMDIWFLRYFTDFWKNINLFFFVWKYPKLSVIIQKVNFLSRAILDSKQMGGYPLSPYITSTATDKMQKQMHCMDIVHL